MKNLNYLMIIFCIKYSRLFLIYHHETWKNNDNPPVRIYVNKTENTVTFKIKTEY